SIFSYSFVGRNIDGMSVEDYVFSIQRKIIRELAEKESCVIVGRCADYILNDRDDVLNVFIHSDMDKRAERIVKLYGETDKSPEKRLKEKDKKRSINYKYCTDRVWGMCQNYDITLNSGNIGIDKCVDIIAELFKSM
ncbi:MAG: cytidylate kinase-like family protein, partial [Clostridia bacterium]|nr:cytidylate kinase-like family protein [Clostridia bacterium]